MSFLFLGSVKMSAEDRVFCWQTDEQVLLDESFCKLAIDLLLTSCPAEVLRLTPNQYLFWRYNNGQLGCIIRNIATLKDAARAELYYYCAENLKMPCEFYLADTYYLFCIDMKTFNSDTLELIARDALPHESEVEMQRIESETDICIRRL